MMQNEMIHTGRVLIVEGKYDAARLAHLTDAIETLNDQLRTKNEWIERCLLYTSDAADD